MGNNRRLAALLKSRTLRMALVALLFTVVYAAFYSGPLPLAVADGLFTIGVLYLLAGMALYIHNIGLFKTFRYWNYRRQFKRQMRDIGNPDAVPMDLPAYTQHIMSLPKKPTAVFLAFGAGLFALSLVMALLIGSTGG